MKHVSTLAAVGALVLACAPMPEFDTLRAGPRTVWTGPDSTQLSVPADLLAVVDHLKTLQDGAE